MKWSELSSRERDVLVAEKIFGLRVGRRKDNPPPPGMQWFGDYDYFLLNEQGQVIAGIPDYTTDLNDAWGVAEYFSVREIKCKNHYTFDEHKVSLYHATRGGHYLIIKRVPLAEAICFCALLAVGVEIDE